MQMSNTYPANSIWIGDRYHDATNVLRGALILGESAWGKPPREDPQWIWHFISKEAVKGDNIDLSFSRLHWLMTDLIIAGRSASELYGRTSSAKLKSWFDLFAFYNFSDSPPRGAETTCARRTG